MPAYIFHAIAVVAGLVLLTRASDYFVSGSAGLARHYGLSPVMVGAVIIGFGTSAPELIVSALAATQDQLALGVGNIVGSSIANQTLVLGVAALVAPLAISTRVLRIEAPLALLAAICFGLSIQGDLTRLKGAGLIAALILALGIIIRTSSSGDTSELTAEVDAEIDPNAPVGRLAIETIVGLVGTIAGAQLLVWGATNIAESAGLSGGFIGLTLVAIGTSLPEMVTAIQAARQGEDELLVGNILGSNVFNALAVGGAIALIGPGSIDDAKLTGTATGIMIIVAAAVWAMMSHGRRVTRTNATVLLAIYAVLVPLVA